MKPALGLFPLAAAIIAMVVGVALAFISTGCARKPAPVAPTATHAEWDISVPSSPRPVSALILFDFDSDVLAPRDQNSLRLIAIKANTYGAAITVTGSADTTGPTQYNLALSARRAHAVSLALTLHGLTVPVSVSYIGEQPGFPAWSRYAKITTIKE